MEEWLINPFLSHLEDWQREGFVQQFHFIHYLDPDYHLRLRFRLTDGIHAGILLQTIYRSCREFLDEDLIWKIEVGTYEPEYERYGIDRILIIEKWFEIDSLFWLWEIKRLSEEGDPDVWKSAVLSVDILLDDFKSSLGNKIQVINMLKESSSSFLKLNRSMKGQLDEKYRKLSDEVDQLLRNYEKILKESLSRRSAEAGIIIKPIQESFGTHELLIESKLLPDLIHMSMNRAFRTRHRMQELIVYDFLSRHYESLKAGGRRGKTEDGRRKTEDGRQKTEEGRQKTEDRRPL